jgi:hypothetical protein
MRRDGKAAAGRLLERPARGLGYTEIPNELYQAGDAETLYAVVRFPKPRRILEIGSENSTVVTSAACKRMHETAPSQISSLWILNPAAD